MKKLMFLILLMLCSLATIQVNYSAEMELVPLQKADGSGVVTYRNTSTPVMTPKNFVEKEEEMRAVWLAAITADATRHASESTWKTAMRKAISVIKSNNMNTLIFQVRPTNDALYKSDLNPWSRTFLGSYSSAEIDLIDPGYDTFAWLVDECHKEGIEIHAWFNPYRVTTTAPEGMTKDEYIQTKLHDMNFAKKNPSYVVTDTTGKLLLNPGEPEVIEFVNDTVMEVVEKYDIDGVHFDDYFYSYEGYAAGFDSVQYDKYKKAGQSLDDWRRSNVDTLVEMVGKSIREYNVSNETEIAFGVSPFGIWDNKAANPLGSNTNGLSSYKTCYADTRKWVKEEWVDYMCPQVYWDFEHTAAPYADCVDWWVDVVKGTNVDLYIGHAIYKYFQGLNPEWKNSPDEIVRQINYNAKYDEIKGSALFSYQYLRDINNANRAVLKAAMEKIATMWKTVVPVPKPSIKEYILTKPTALSTEDITKIGSEVKMQFEEATYDGDGSISYEVLCKIDDSGWTNLDVSLVKNNNRYYFRYIIPEGDKLYLKILASADKYKAESDVLEKTILPRNTGIIEPSSKNIELSGEIMVGKPIKISWNQTIFPNDLDIAYILMYHDGTNWIDKDISGQIIENDGILSVFFIVPEVETLKIKIRMVERNVSGTLIDYQTNELEKTVKQIDAEIEEPTDPIDTLEPDDEFRYDILLISLGGGLVAFAGIFVFFSIKKKWFLK